MYGTNPATQKNKKGFFDLLGNLMNIFELNRELNKVAELQKDFPPDDALTVLIQEYVNEELSANDLEWVSAAGIRPDYQAFLKLLDEKKRR